MQSTACQLLLARCAIFFEQPTVTEKQMEEELPSHSKTFLSVEDYLRIEESALRKSEYLNGEMTEMSGVSREHTLIVTISFTGWVPAHWCPTKFILQSCD
jgi:hypothetical protein